MARTRAQLTAVPRWAGLLVVLTLALCSTGLARPAVAAPMATMSTASMTSPQPARPDGSVVRHDGVHVQEVAAPSCPMDGMVMDCRPSVQYRPSSALLPPATHIASAVADDMAAPVEAQRAPPRPASREGPDLDRLCVSRI
ncbi:hypothetical protein ACIPSH_21170 [Streptomyces iakyrus]|uniref:Uncharacterized protein n=1 Tax=Streptomyces sp. SID7499 TaxID=2706086 RepID=A0A6G3WVI8_9ACTN|nr:hypothetical protein [Streptomyces sp. SID7499]